ncbi:MAG: DUF4349 domain-containing protein [Dysgonamonadaceae bacterium]|jgi:hypothetical protein|nr:DUF4349 domain-containing protein [Dysgonamonadaceae bacterium]
MKRILQLLILTTLLIGCGKSGIESAESNELMNNQPATDKIDKDLRKLIKEANLRFRTKDNQEAYSLIKNSLKGYGAYISEENTFNYSNRTGFDLTLRVPAERFDSLLNFIVANVNIKELDNKSTQIKDVTEEFIDIQARIKIKKESEQKLSDLLKQAKNLSETLEIQKQLTDLRADIESIEGRLKYLTDQVNYSTIRISFYENIKYSKRFFGDFWDALKDGWQVFLHLITLLTYLWVVILVFFLIRWGYKYYKREYKEKNKNNAA